MLNETLGVTTPVAKANSGATRALLACGVAAGPIYVVLALIQMLIREGFDMRRHALSLMSNGDLGWIQIANFTVTGVLVFACAIGMRRALYPGRACTWGPPLLMLYGLGLIGAGIFVADPVPGFPPGTPEEATKISGHGLMHFVSGAFGFLGLIAACFVFARRFAGLHQPGWALFSLATGVLFFLAFFGIASGAGKPSLIIAFYLAVLLAWIWLSAISFLILTQNSAPKARLA